MVDNTINWKFFAPENIWDGWININTKQFFYPKQRKIKVANTNNKAENEEDGLCMLKEQQDFLGAILMASRDSVT